jgi:hypothetical protein
MDVLMSSLNPLRPVNLCRVTKNSCSVGDETASKEPNERTYCQSTELSPAPAAAKELLSIPVTLAAIAFSFTQLGCGSSDPVHQPKVIPATPAPVIPEVDAEIIGKIPPPDVLAEPDAGFASPDTTLPEIDAGIMADVSPPDVLAEPDAGLASPDTMIPEIDAGIMADAFVPDILAAKPDTGTLIEAGQAVDGSINSLPPGFGPNSCPAFSSPEEKQLVFWPRLDSMESVPINVSPANTAFFKAHPILMEQARQELRSMWNSLAVAGHEHWFDGIQRKGLMLFDVSRYYVEGRQGLGLNAYPDSPFMPDNYILGYPTGAGFGDLGAVCNEGVQIFYRLLHAPYAYRRALTHEFVHWFEAQWRRGAPGVDLNSIDFSHQGPPFSSANYCYSGTAYGESSANSEENRAEYVMNALFFPGSRAIFAEADRLLGCDPAITTTRDELYQQVARFYFNGLTPPDESASVQNWLRVYLFYMRGLQANALASAKAYVEANPNDADGIKSIYYTLFIYKNPDKYVQSLPAVPYKGGTYSGLVYEKSFPTEYSDLIGRIINNPINPGGVPYAEEVIRYSLWYKAMMEAYPKNMIDIRPPSVGRTTFSVYSESDLSAAKNTLSVLTARIAKEEHPLVGEIGLLNALIDYWRSNKPLKTSTGFQFPARM